MIKSTRGEGQALALRTPPGRRGFKPRLPLFSARGGLSPARPICLNQDVQDSQDFQDYEGFDSTCFFRSVRTCMSIEMARFQKLGFARDRPSRSSKGENIDTARDRPSCYSSRCVPLSRSAGACPPRTYLSGSRLCKMNKISKMMSFAAARLLLKGLFLQVRKDLDVYRKPSLPLFKVR